MKDLSNENIVHVKKDGIEYLQFRKLLEYVRIETTLLSLNFHSLFQSHRNLILLSPALHAPPASLRPSHKKI